MFKTKSLTNRKIENNIKKCLPFGSVVYQKQKQRPTATVQKNKNISAKNKQ